jgi:transcriptional regulator with XRE-family HTH domain
MPIDDPYLFDDTIVASGIKSWRQKRGLTMEQLSALTKAIDPAALGVSRVSLSRYENGDSLPGLRELRLISFAIRCPLSLLIYRERIDPMSSYKIELEMRITDTFMGSVSADGLLKESSEQTPETDAQYLELLERIKTVQ